MLVYAGNWLWILLAAWVSATAYGQISPGPLSRAHQDLEGATKCTSCHAFGVGQRTLKCLDCHTEIARRVTAKSGFHGNSYKASATQLDCARCHSEHNGKNFQLTKFDRTNFDHAKLGGFELQGKHAALKCDGCHTAAKVSQQPREIRMKDFNKTFLGLGRECVQCHQDPHKSEFGTECATCHSQIVWKPAELFDHSKSSYPLTGKHAAVECSGCHKPKAGETMPGYRGLRYASCDNCHADPHKGAFENAAFAAACSTCHITAGWKALKTDTGFNHDRTKFPLVGKHAEVTCFKCHTSSDFSQPVAHAICADCHKDVHGGQFASRANGSDCAACHDEKAFKPSLYTLEQHQLSPFRLEGKHERLECAACHKPAAENTKYRFTSTTCESCHSDPHGTQFTAKPLSNQCETCHTQSVFHPSTFSLPRHQQTRFALTGAHQAVVCGDCHKPLPGEIHVAARQYHFTDQTCTACHMDPHQTKQSCETCHNTAQWKAVRTFDHSTTQFKLEGAHETTTCAGCHRPAPAAAVRSAGTISFAKIPTTCHECHEDIHGGQFMSAGEERECTACHTVVNWNSRAFDHNRTKFSLEGAHEKVRCAQCHTQTLSIDGREARLYRGAPLECKACHADGNGIAR